MKVYYTQPDSRATGCQNYGKTYTDVARLEFAMFHKVLLWFKNSQADYLIIQYIIQKYFILPENTYL